MIEILFILIAAVISVLLFSRLGFGAVLGYLAAGAVIGPAGFALVVDPESIRHVGEFGVVFLLFMIGIEIKPQRLWVMRKMVFGLGGFQVLVSGLLISILALQLNTVSFPAALIIGFGLSLSSTAFCVQIMAERNQLTSQWGRASFSILLLQDLAVVPLMALVPLIAAGGLAPSQSMGIAFLESAGIFLLTLIGGRLAIGPALRAIARSRNHEAFAAFALLLVLGGAWIMEHAGLSMAMGAFIAGMMLADSEFRHQIEADIDPFRGLLLGLFFISVGMTLAPQAILDNLGLVIGGTLCLILAKIGVIYGAARLFNLDKAGSVRTAFLLAQAGEFGFVLFSLADQSAILPDGLLEPLISIIVLSMIVTPLLTNLGERVAQRFTPESQNQPVTNSTETADQSPVIIAGFGRVGETVAHMLGAQGKNWVAVDKDIERVERARAAGQKLYYGDAARAEVLRAVGAGKAKVMIITLDNAKAAEKTTRIVRQLYPDLTLVVRARNLSAAKRLNALGIQHVVPETLEASIQLGASACLALGTEDGAVRTMLETLRADNYTALTGLHAEKQDSEPT